MIKSPLHPPLAHPAGFSLVEVALALGIAAFALVAIFGLLPTGINSNRAATEQTAALNIATVIVTDLRVTVPNAPPPSTPTIATSPRLGIKIPLSTPNYPVISGTSSTLYLDESGSKSGLSVARYRVTFNFAVPPAGQRMATLAKVTVSWPAPATLANATGSVTTFVALDRN